MTFDQFIGIDWSGAKGCHHPHLQLACCDSTARVMLHKPPSPRGWARQAVLDMLIQLGSSNQRILVGLDYNFAFPFQDEGRYLPGMPNTPKSFWRAVEASCAEDTDLAGHGFVENFEAYFLRPGKRGTSYALRQRVVETHMVQQSLGWAETVFKLIGPSQVGLGALAGMRLLHQLKKALGSKVAIWPFEAPEAPLVVVEAFPRAYIRMAGLGQRKLRNRADLKVALAHFDAKARTLPKDLTDDMCDALVTAAALRSLSRDSHVWRPKTLSARVRATEGWVFGVS